MKLTDRVKIINSAYKENCEGIKFKGLIGSIIAKVGSEDWLVLFDKDICGKAIVDPSCDHDFIKSASPWTKFTEGTFALCRNQRFFPEHDLELLEPIKSVIIDPINNDGRSICFWCNVPTKQILGFSSNSYDVCIKCGK